MNHTLRRFQALLQWMILLCYNYSKTTIVLFLFFIVALFFQFKPIGVQVSVDKMINANFETSREYFQLVDNYNLGTESILLITPKGPQKRIINSKELCGIRRSMSKVYRHNELAIASLSPFELRKPTVENSIIPKLLYPALLELDCLNEDVDGVIPRNPWEKLLYSGDFSDVLISYEVATTDEFNFHSEVLPKIFQNDVENWTPSDEIETHWLGQYAYNYWVMAGLIKNSILNLSIIIIIVITFWLLFKTFSSSILFISGLLLSCMILIGFMSITGTPIDVMNNPLFLLLAVSSMGDFIFLSNHSIKTNLPIIESFKEMALPSFFTSLTTFIGFISLTTSNLDIIKSFGIWTAVSGVIEWLVTFLFLPAVIKVCMKSRRWVKSGTKSFLIIDKVSKFKLNKKVAIGFLTMYGLLLFMPKKLNVNDTPSEMLLESNPYSQSLKVLKSKKGFSSNASLVINTKDLKKKKEIERNIVKAPLVSFLESSTKLKKFFFDGLPQRYHKNVIRDLESSVIYKRLVSHDNERFILYLKSDDLHEVTKLRKYVSDELCPNRECYLTGPLVAYADFAREVPGTFFTSLFWSLFFVFFVLFFLKWATGTKKIFLITVTAFWGNMIVITVIYFLQVEINFLTAVTLSILTGLTGDNLIQYMLGSDGITKEVNSKGSASLINTLLMSICSVVFLFYYFAPPKVFGALVILGFLSSYFGDIVLLKSLQDED